MHIPKWLTIIAWLVFFAIVYWPLYQLIADSFGYEQHLTKVELSNTFYLTENQCELLKRSLILASIATAIALLIGIPYALLLYRTTMWGQEIFKFLSMLPLLIPPYMYAILWNNIFSPDGWINSYVLTVLHIQILPIETRNLLAASVVLAYSYFPFVIILTGNGLNNLDTSYEEAALLNSNRLKTLISVSLPMVTPQILAGAIFVFIFSIIDFGVPDAFQVRVYPVEIFIEYSALFNERAAIILAMPLLIINSILVALALWIMKGRSYINFYSTNEQFSLNPTGIVNIFAICYCSIVVLITVVVPIICLFDMVGPLQYFIKAWSASYGIIGYSLLLAIIGAMFTVLIAFFIAHSLMYSTGFVKLTLEYIAQLPFAFIPLLLGIGLIKAWNQPLLDRLYNSSAIIIIGYVAHLIPFAIRIIYSGLQQVPQVLEEVGLLTGVQWWRRLWVITIPLVSNSLLVGLAIGSVFALSDLGTSLLIMPPGSETTPILIYNYLHYGANNLVAAFCLMLILFQCIIGLGGVVFYNMTKTSRLT